MGKVAGIVAVALASTRVCFAQTTDPFCNAGTRAGANREIGFHRLAHLALAEYECEFKTPSGVLYDLRRLCLGSSPYSYTDANGTTYSFQICGTSNVRCQPVGYRVEFNFAPAMQFFGDPPSTSDCTDNFNNPVPCTRACEVLGSGASASARYKAACIAYVFAPLVGPPIIGLLDASDSYAGVNVSYYSVPSRCAVRAYTGSITCLSAFGSESAVSLTLSLAPSIHE